MDKETFKEDLEAIQQRVKIEEMDSATLRFIIILARVVLSLAEEVEKIKLQLKKGGTHDL